MSSSYTVFLYLYVYVLVCLHPQGFTSSSIKEQICNRYFRLCRPDSLHNYSAVPWTWLSSNKTLFTKQGNCQIYQFTDPDRDCNCPCKLFPNLQHQETAISSAKCLVNKMKALHKMLPFFFFFFFWTSSVWTCF